MHCIDLRTVGPYRLLNELTGAKAKKTDDPWELLIPGRAGDVSPWGGEYLLASTRSMATTRRILEAVPGAAVTQDADDGQNVRFPASALPVVAGILRLRKRRVVVLSEERAAALVEAGSPYRLTGASRQNDGAI